MTGTSPRVLGLALLIAVAVLLPRCDGTTASPPAAATVPSLTIQDLRVNAAHQLTRAATRRVPAWNISAKAAGHDCGTLLVEVGVNMETSLVDGLQYGVDPYDVTKGGIQTYSRQHYFRAVAYKDAAGRVWRYGPVTLADAESLVPCR
jgi:hypothetical protein